MGKGKEKRTESKSGKKLAEKIEKKSGEKKAGARIYPSGTEIPENESPKRSQTGEDPSGRRLPERYRTVYRNGEGRYEEKKSVFIATVRHVSDSEEATAFVEEMKKKYWGARHNCYAWVLGKDGANRKASDDGEPSGTAGRPILDVLTGAGLTDACIVVTRYFGGVLLGTGGLVRAYTQASRDGIDKSVLIEKENGVLLDIIAAYTDAGKIQYLIGREEIPTVESDFSDVVRIRVVVPASEETRFTKQIAEATAGRAGIQKNGRAWFGVAGGKLILEPEQQE